MEKEIFLQCYKFYFIIIKGESKKWFEIIEKNIIIHNKNILNNHNT